MSSFIRYKDGWFWHVCLNGLFFWILSGRYHSWTVFYPPCDFQQSVVLTSLSGKIVESTPSKWSVKTNKKEKLNKNDKTQEHKEKLTKMPKNKEFEFSRQK